MTESPALRAANELKHMMIARSTASYDSPKIPVGPFRDVRGTVMSDPVASKLAPECVRVCRSPDEVWSYVEAQNGLDRYDERREFFRVEFEPMLSALENLDSTPLDELVAIEAGA